MEQIGERKRFFKPDSLRAIDYTERPEALPPLGLNENVYAGVDKGEGEVMYLLSEGQGALGEVQQLHDFVTAKQAKKVTFYIG